MENLVAVAVMISMLALAVVHCWCLSILFSHRFGPVKCVAWFFPLILLPLIGPAIFIISTRRFREANRPTRKREAAIFVAVFSLFLSVCIYIGIVQYRQFNRRAADVAALSDLRNARAFLLEYIETSGNAPNALSDINFVPSSPHIHLTYKRVGLSAFELTGWHEKGVRKMRTSSSDKDIEQAPGNKP